MQVFGGRHYAADTMPAARFSSRKDCVENRSSGRPSIASSESGGRITKDMYEIRIPSLALSVWRLQFGVQAVGSH